MKEFKTIEIKINKCWPGRRQYSNYTEQWYWKVKYVIFNTYTLTYSQQFEFIFKLILF